jgi:hypothetical protein
MLSNIILALPLLGAVSALPTTLHKREVPQEHAHQNVLDIVDSLVALNNPDNLGSSVFGLLGAAAAAGGLGDLTDADCLQQSIADQAFTNGKAAGDVNGQTFALIYRALERNTGSVGLASVPCASVTAVNAEIAALQQHQDPAGEGAIALNKEIATELAKQIAAVGGDTSLANEASTFAPGEIGDATAAGNTCDDENDKLGCINSQKLRVDDLSAAEIEAAVSGVAAAGGVVGNASAADGAAAGNATAVAGDAAACAAPADVASAPEPADAANATEAADAADATKAPNAAGAAGAVDAQGCDLSVVFTDSPADGRGAAAFEATDLATFPHGSALKIGVISDFICQQAVNKCNLDTASADACNAASATAKKLEGQAAADAFNAAVAA